MKCKRYFLIKCMNPQIFALKESRGGERELPLPLTQAITKAVRFFLLLFVRNNKQRVGGGKELNTSPSGHGRKHRICFNRIISARSSHECLSVG